MQKMRYVPGDFSFGNSWLLNRIALVAGGTQHDRAVRAGMLDELGDVSGKADEGVLGKQQRAHPGQGQYQLGGAEKDHNDDEGEQCVLDVHLQSGRCLADSVADVGARGSGHPRVRLFTQAGGAEQNHFDLLDDLFLPQGIAAFHQLR